MKKLFIIPFTLSVLVCCTRIEQETQLQVDEKWDSPQMEISLKVFESKEELREGINSVNMENTKGAVNSNFTSLFTPAKSVDMQNDPVLSYEWSRCGVQNENSSLTIYELFGYDELVPNEGFAKLLNARGEVCVRDTIYKISPRGTYFFPISKQEEFEKNYSKYEQIDGVEIRDRMYRIDADVYRYDTFNDIDEEYAFTVISNDEGVSYLTKSDPSFPYINWSSFPLYVGSVNDYFRNQVLTCSLPNNRRVRTKIYHNDYIIYDERGATLKCQKSGLGWSAVTSNALMLTWKNIILKSSHAAGELAPPSNIIPTFVRETVSYMGQNETLMTIRGYVIPDNLLNSVVSGGASTFRSIVLNATGIDTNNCRLFVLKGHEYIQTFYLGSWHVSGSNVKEVKMALSENWMGSTAQPLGGQFWYQALDDNNNLGALRVGTAF